MSTQTFVVCLEKPSDLDLHVFLGSQRLCEGIRASRGVSLVCIIVLHFISAQFVTGTM